MMWPGSLGGLGRGLREVGVVMLRFMSIGGTTSLVGFSDARCGSSDRRDLSSGGTPGCASRWLVFERFRKCHELLHIT